MKIATTSAVLLLFSVAGFIGGRFTATSRPCQPVVVDAGAFLHMGNSAIVMISSSVLSQMFGEVHENLTLYYGTNRAILPSGEDIAIRGPLRKMGHDVRAVFVSGDQWQDLLVPVYAAELDLQVLLHIDLKGHTIRIVERQRMSHVIKIAKRDGSLEFELPAKE